MEEKLRRRDILVPEVRMADFYAERLAGVFDLRGLEKRIRAAGGDDFLRMDEQDLILSRPGEEELAGFPDEVDFDGRPFRALYRFAPGEEDDGITVSVPLPLLKGIPGEHTEWGVPGQLEDKVAALIKGLPKAYRKLLLPAAEKVDIIVKEMKPKDPSLYKNLARFVKERFGVEIPQREWAQVEVPKHLRLRIAVTDHEGRMVAAGRDIEFLKKIAPQASAAVPEGSPAWENALQKWERSGITSWDFGPLPESIRLSMFITAYPALVPEEKGAGIRLFKTREQALAAHEKGVEALLRPRFEKDLEFVKRYLALPEEYQTAALYFGGRSAIAGKMAESLSREVFRKGVRSREEFDSYSETVVRSLFDKGHKLRQTVIEILEAYLKTRRTLQAVEEAGRSRRSIGEVAAQIKAELERLVPKDFLDHYTVDQLLHFPRYLKALDIRAERGKNDPEKDRKKAEQVVPFEDALRRISARQRSEASIEKKKAVKDFRWMIEEFKVAQFAPELKTAFPVSAKRLSEKLREIENLD
jgi:ATP-dependent helicase HrpA